jgi:hypothetical protein
MLQQLRVQLLLFLPCVGLLVFDAGCIPALFWLYAFFQLLYLY